MGSSEEQQRDKKPPYIDDDRLIINTRLSEIERQQKEEKKYERDRDRKQMFFNGMLTLFTALLFVTSAVSDFLIWRYVSLTKQSADAAKSAADSAKSQAVIALNALEQSQRPWLSVMAYINGPFEFGKNGDAAIRIRFYIKNIGHSPALYVHVISRLGDAHSIIPNPCRRRSAKNSSYEGAMLFPNDDMTEVDQIVMQAAEVRKAMKKGMVRPNDGMLPEVFGCVDYKFGFEEGHHQTKFIYWINSNGIDITPPPVGKTKSIAKAVLSLTKDPRGDLGAD